MKLIVTTTDARTQVFELEEGADLILGASAGAQCAVTGEPYLSRRHARLRVRGGMLEVERILQAKNPIFFKGAPIDRFPMSTGDYFVIGHTTFQLQGEQSPTAAAPRERSVPDPTFELAVSAAELRARGTHADRMRLLDLMELPEVLRTRERREFYAYACGLLRMTTSAAWVRVIQVEPDRLSVLGEDAADDQLTLKPVSQSLIKASVERAPLPLAYCWTQRLDNTFDATAHEGIDWAVACAMKVPGESPVLFYLAGSDARSTGQALRGIHPDTRGMLRDTARLVGFVADTIGRAVALQKVENWEHRLERFFSGKLISKILESDASEALAPRITEATVMFFDIRGFGLLTEGNLQRILEYEGELRRALTEMTQCVFDHGGVVLRYMGDGMLACWNVPYTLDRHVEKACLSALAMVERLAMATSGWACGIGLGVGEVVAGSLGSDQVYAYDILGAVANQTARVEGITKAVGVPILVTEEVANTLDPSQILARRVARFRPVGMDLELNLYTIHRAPSDAPARKALTDRFERHGAGLAAFEAGHWEKAFEILHPIVQEDAAAKYVYKLALQGKPPRDWRGVVELSAK